LRDVTKPSLLIFTDWFPPGYRAGGPIRSTANLVAALRNDFDIHVVTSDRDFGSDHAYTDVVANRWLPYGGTASVIYLSPSRSTWPRINAIINEVGADCIYLNSMFSPKFTVAPLWSAWRGRVKARIVLAPRGMLHAGAMQFHATRKQIFLWLFRALGMWSQLWFHATDEQEGSDIHHRLGVSAQRIRTIPNLPEPPVEAVTPIDKTIGALRLLYLSRITPKKQLLQLLNTLAQLPDDISVSLTIAGPVEDGAYWQSCRTSMSTLPAHIRVKCIDAVPHNGVRKILESHHCFVLPTLGENYGHGIIEALGAGRPVIISDQTPWRGLEAAGVGWDVPVNDCQALVEAILAAARLDQAGYDAMSSNAWSYAKAHATDPATIEGYKRLLGPM
jgi:glycosyltransferase involved in cell wall biosynthesis